jgi:putative flippase GtrA
VRQHAQALAVFALAWGLTSGSLAVLHASAPAAGTVAEILTLTAANLAATLLRFALLRSWVFRARTRTLRVAAPSALPIREEVR